ncbi:MAG: TonB-dependent hemoglobin/transferrin/lactoferrin family receptor [Steroidobacteraceae bacterium]
MAGAIAIALAPAAMPAEPAVFGAPAAPAVSPTPDTLQTITVTARAPRPLIEAAASVAVIDTQALQALQSRGLEDLARYEPGFSVGNDATRFGAGAPSIRGIGGNRVLVEVDGVPVAQSFAIGSYSDAPRAYGDLDLVRRIEILRGPASSLYGSDAIGGVIAIHTLDPADLLRDGGATARVRAQHRTDDDGTLVSGIVADRAGPLQWLGAWAHRESSELDIASRFRQPNPRDARHDTFLVRGVGLGEEAPVRLTLSYERGQVGTDVQSNVLAAGTRFANTTAMLGDDRVRNYIASLDQGLQGIGPFSRMEWHLYTRRSDTNQRTWESRRAVAPRTPATDLYRQFRFTEKSIGGGVTGSRDLEAFGASHRLVTGIELLHRDVTELRDGFQRTVSTGAVTNVMLGEEFPLRDFPQTRITSAGLFVQDELRIGDGRIAWTPALRVDHYRLDPHVDAIYATDNPRTPGVQLQHTALSPRLGIAWLVSPETTLFMQYAHGFRSPPFEDVNIGFDLPALNYRAIPNPDLRPERSDSVEAGVRRAAHAVSGTASVFYSRYRDFIESRVNLGPDATGTTIFQSLNLARARIAGAELAGEWRAGTLSPALAGVTMRFAASYIRGDDTVRNRPLESVDPPKAVLGLAYAAHPGTWGAGSTLTAAQASRALQAGSAGPLARAAGYATLDFDAWWRPVPSLQVRAAVFNAFDRSYFEWADIHGRAAADASLELFRRPGRSLAVSFTYSLK